MHMKSRLFRFGFLMLWAGAMLCAFEGGAYAVPPNNWHFLYNVTLTADGVGIPLNPPLPQTVGPTANSSATIPSTTTSVTVTVELVDANNLTVNGTAVPVAIPPPDPSITLNWPLANNSIVVIARNGAHTDTFTITRAAPSGDSTIPVTGFIVSPDVMSLDLEGKSKDHVVGIITPSNATNQGVLWKVEPAGIVKLAHTSSNSGEKVKVTALKNGFAKITGTTWDGNHSDTCDVTVGGLSLAVAPNESELEIGESVLLEAVTTPSGAYDGGFVWSSDVGADQLQIVSQDRNGARCLVRRAGNYMSATVTAKATASPDLEAGCHFPGGDLYIKLSPTLGIKGGVLYAAFEWEGTWQATFSTPADKNYHSFMRWPYKTVDVATITLYKAVRNADGEWGRGEEASSAHYSDVDTQKPFTGSLNLSDLPEGEYFLVLAADSFGPPQVRGISTRVFTYGGGGSSSCLDAGLFMPGAMLLLPLAMAKLARGTRKK